MRYEVFICAEGLRIVERENEGASEDSATSISHYALNMPIAPEH